METKTYLIKTDYDYANKQVVQIDGNTLTIQFRVMDNYSMLEIKGILKDRTNEEFKHQILCHREQNLLVLNTKDDQIDNQGKEFDKDRIRFEVTHEEQKVDHGQFDKINKQIDIEELIKEQN